VAFVKKKMKRKRHTCKRLFLECSVMSTCALIDVTKRLQMFMIACFHVCTFVFFASVRKVSL
jgi:hypothetical protein